MVSRYCHARSWKSSVNLWGVSDIPLYDTKAPPQEVADHPLFAGKPTGIMAAGKPLVAPQVSGEADALRGMLKQQGLNYEETDGSYGGYEPSFIVHGPTRAQMYGLGKALGQESVVFSSGGNHELLYTNGPNDGKSHPAHPRFGFHPTTPPPDYYTKLPGRGYFRLYFDDSKLNDVPLQKSEPLVKRSKNVREQTRNIYPHQAESRRIQYARRIGLDPQRGYDTWKDFPPATENKIRYGGPFPVEHETAHAMTTPPGRAFPEYQGNVLNQMRGTPAKIDESVANQMENLIDRRSGVAPSQFRTESRRPSVGLVDTETKHKIEARGFRSGAAPFSLIPNQHIKRRAAENVARFDAGARFDEEGNVLEPEEATPLNARINSGEGGVKWLREVRNRLRWEPKA